MSLTKWKTHLPTENMSTERLPSKNVSLKDKNVFTEQKRKRVFRAEMSLSKHIFAFARSLHSVMEFSLDRRIFAIVNVILAW